MSIPLRARLIDVVNLVVSKGANFAVTVVVFGFVAHQMDAATFAGFGYWWSIALLFGGGALGGLSSATIRAVARFGTLRQERRMAHWAAIGVLALTLAASCLVFAVTRRFDAALLAASVCLFGVAVQIQTAIAGLLRAVEASWSNLITSVVMLVTVPLVLLAAMTMSHDPSVLFAALAGGFLVSAIATAFVGRHALSPLILAKGVTVPRGEFLSTTLAFSFATIFSYGLTNLDYTILKVLVSNDAFTLVSQSKVFFDRFALPVMLITAGAVSLNVLRYSGDARQAEPRLQIRRLGFASGVTALVWVCLVVGYYAYSAVLSKGPEPLPVVQVACIAFGYVVYAANSVLIDLLIIKRRVVVVGINLALLFVMAAIVEGVLIWLAGVSGWVIGWPFVNVVAFVVLARVGLDVSRQRPDAEARIAE